KPDAVQRAIVGDIVSRFERVGLKIVGMKMVRPDREHYHHHYEEISKLISRRGQEVFDVNLEFMMNGPVVALVLEGLGAVELVRKMVGETEPATAQPGTVRGDYSHISFSHANSIGAGIPNLIHASGDKAEAEQEIKLWFTDSELYRYEAAHEGYTQPRKAQRRHQ
ncbi:MAG TPA: nucleoside-diphosphate kinase, partial [Candidatus Polarisedimenticolaceae bacterium]|nr:nucleoside-diphosphate kinase [Candidatus Polarisedimenticolaceae bacterium]